MKKIINLKKILITLFIVISATLGAYAFTFRNITLDFVHISDTHISSDRQDTSYKALGSSRALLRDAVEQINEIQGLDFVLFTGDMVDSATADNFKEFYRELSRLKYPHLNVFGNHDFYGMEKSDVVNIIKKYNPNYAFNNTYYAFSPKTDYRIIVLDAVDTNLQTSNGKLSEEQLAFLDSELEQNQNKVVVIALHHPPIEPFIAQEHSLLNADDFNNILLKYKNPIVVLSGHYHAAKIRQIGNLMYVSTPAMVTYPMAFRHIKITNYKDRVLYSFDFIPTRLDDIKEKNRQSVISYGTLAGYLKDRDNKIIYRKNNYKSVSYKKSKIKNATKRTKTSKREIKRLTKQPKVQKTKKQRTKRTKNNSSSELN